MEAGQIPQIEKREYRNQTGGWLGVVVIDPKGDERGTNVEPYGTVWLSDAEVILTARAPRRPEDNPFEEQAFVVFNEESGRNENVMVRPLVPSGDDRRYVPSMDRYIPPQATTGAHAAVQAEAGAQDPSSAATSAAQAAAEAAVHENPPAQGAVAGMSVLGVPLPGPGVVSAQPPPPATPPAAQPAPVATPGDGPPPPAPEATSWTDPPPAPGEVLAGSLAGSDEPSPQAQAEAAPDPTEPPAEAVAPPQAPVPAPPPTAPAADVGEETASAVDPAVGEETGQAKPPSGPAVEGEFAAAEEVGSPEAPQATPESAPEGS